MPSSLLSQNKDLCYEYKNEKKLYSIIKEFSRNFENQLKNYEDAKTKEQKKIFKKLLLSNFDEEGIIEVTNSNNEINIYQIIFFIDSIVVNNNCKYNVVSKKYKSIYLCELNETKDTEGKKLLLGSFEYIPNVCDTIIKNEIFKLIAITTHYGNKCILKLHNINIQETIN